MGTSSAPLRYGESANACSSCMTDGPRTYCRRYRLTLQAIAEAEADALVLQGRSPVKAAAQKPMRVVRRFNSLNRSQMQDVLNFLRSL